MKQIFAYKGRGFVPLMSTLQAALKDIDKTETIERTENDNRTDKN